MSYVGKNKRHAPAGSVVPITSKTSGRNNPNCKYPLLDDNFFHNVDTDEKAYLLGWIGSDGTIQKRGFRIAIHQKDIKVLEILRNIICHQLPIYEYKTSSSSLCSLSVNSQQIAIDLYKIFGLQSYEKSNTIQFPALENDRLRYFFLRGYFEGDGCIVSPSEKQKYPIACITSNSASILNDIGKFINLSCYIGKSIAWSNMRAIEFLDRIYADKLEFSLKRKYELYLFWKENYSFHPNTNMKRSEVHHNAKLTNDQVKNIRILFADGNNTIKSISATYNVSYSIIYKIVNNKTWKDIK